MGFLKTKEGKNLFHIIPKHGDSIVTTVAFKRYRIPFQHNPVDNGPVKFPQSMN